MDTPLGALSGAAGGMADAVADIIHQRLQQAQLASQISQQQETARANQANEAIRQQQIVQTALDRQANAAENVRYHDMMNADRVSKEGQALNESMQPGTDFSPANPMAPYLSSVPKMSTAPAPPSALAADPTQQGPVNLPGTIANAPSPVLGRLLTKTPTFKQSDTTDKADRAWQAVSNLADTTAANQELRSRGLDIQQQVGQARIEAAQAKADAAAAKFPQMSAGAKTSLAAIEQAAPLTDQVLTALEKQYPGIKEHPEQFNSVGDKGSAELQKIWYGLGFGSEDEGRKQIESLLQPVQAGQYMRSSRSRQQLNLVLSHMADQGQTPGAQYQRLQTLRSLMPEMREGVIRAEQPVDPNNPLAGSYLGRVPGGAPPPAATGGPAPATGGEWIDIGGGIKVRKK